MIAKLSLLHEADTCEELIIAIIVFKARIAGFWHLFNQLQSLFSGAALTRNNRLSLLLRIPVQAPILVLMFTGGYFGYLIIAENHFRVNDFITKGIHLFLSAFFARD